MTKLSRRELASKKREEEQAKKEASFIRSARLAADSAAPQAEYERLKEAAKRFDAVWNSSHDRKHILVLMLRRIASLIESSFLANAASAGAKSAAWNVTGALLGGAEGAGSMSQMGVQQADMRYRTARIASDNLYQLAQEVKEVGVDLDPDLMEQAKNAALRIRKEGFGKSFENISSLVAAADNLVSYAYGFDLESVAGLAGIERNREEAFKKFWNQNCIRVGMSGYETDGKKHYRRLFHDNSQT